MHLGHAGPSALFGRFFGDALPALGPDAFRFFGQAGHTTPGFERNNRAHSQFGGFPDQQVERVSLDQRLPHRDVHGRFGFKRGPGKNIAANRPPLHFRQAHLVLKSLAVDDSNAITGLHAEHGTDMVHVGTFQGDGFFREAFRSNKKTAHGGQGFPGSVNKSFADRIS